MCKNKWLMHVQLLDGRYGRVKGLTDACKDLIIKFEENEEFETVPANNIKFVLSENEFLKRYKKYKARKGGIIL